MADYFGKETPKLGFGFMRLPKLENGETDLEQVKQMVNVFMAAGQTYFDTAYVYDNGKSEEALRETLVKRYPRDMFTVATKLCAWLQGHDEASAKQQFYTSLERTGAGYIDYYLLHALKADNYKKCDEYHLWDFLRELKEKGLVRHYGFSFHAAPELLDELLTAQPDVDFIQLQLNYADWENEKVQSRACYEVARRHGKSITVMEPVKGGLLANPPKAVRELVDAADPGMSYASWAIRYVASLDGIITVLSGMSNLAQVEDNVSYMKQFKPLTEREEAVIAQAKTILAQQKSIPCTACHYCVDGCPKKIPIPEIFSACNDFFRYENKARAAKMYQNAVKEKGKASDCIRCGKCEKTCPQQLKVRGFLEEAAKLFD